MTLIVFPAFRCLTALWRGFKLADKQKGCFKQRIYINIRPGRLFIFELLKHVCLNYIKYLRLNKVKIVYFRQCAFVVLRVHEA